jgi:hypothetical protein
LGRVNSAIALLTLHDHEPGRWGATWAAARWCLWGQRCSACSLGGVSWRPSPSPSAGPWHYSYSGLLCPDGPTDKGAWLRTRRVQVRLLLGVRRSVAQRQSIGPTNRGAQVRVLPDRRWSWCSGAAFLTVTQEVPGRNRVATPRAGCSLARQAAGKAAASAVGVRISPRSLIPSWRSGYMGMLGRRGRSRLAGQGRSP